MKNGYYNNRKLILSVIYIIVGIVLLVLSILEQISDPIYSGFGGALIAVGILQLVRNIKYQTNPEYKQQIDIAANDERNKGIRERAWAITGYIAILSLAIVSLVFWITDQQTLGQALSICMCGELAIYCIAYFILNKKY